MKTSWLVGDVNKKILEIVEERPGIKATELVVPLVVWLFENYDPKDYNEIDLVQSLYDLADKEEIIELSYVLPNMQYRTKSLFFPKGTLIFKEKNITYEQKDDKKHAV